MNPKSCTFCGRTQLLLTSVKRRNYNIFRFKDLNWFLFRVLEFGGSQNENRVREPVDCNDIYG
jgi:hypothetical protein